MSTTTCFHREIRKKNIQRIPILSRIMYVAAIIRDGKVPSTWRRVCFHWMPRKVMSWALRKFDVGKWIVRLVQGMYANARIRVRVGERYSDEFEVKADVHQGSVLSPLLFVIVLEALSREVRSGIPWEDYANGLVIIAKSLEECVRRLLTWKKQWRRKTESKCRKDEDHDLWYEPGPPAEFRRVSMRRLVCRTGVGSNSIFCNGCKHWVHKVCSWLMCLTKRPWLQMGGRKQREVLAWQAGGGSFFFLPRRHALSSWWLWTFNNNTWKPSGKSALTPPPPHTHTHTSG